MPRAAPSRSWAQIMLSATVSEPANVPKPQSTRGDHPAAVAHGLHGLDDAVAREQQHAVGQVVLSQCAVLGLMAGIGERSGSPAAEGPRVIL